jgi:uncharacterized phage protein (TIGR01671 family)
MREILFRGKRCDNGEWAQGYYIRAEHHWHKHGIHKDWITLGAYANGGWFALHNKYAVKAETVGQFTGLTDKNGKKIFEGDILDVMHQGVFECRWDEGNFEFGLSNRKESFGIAYVSPNDIFVIGNIHDNPELLENP